MRVAKKAEAQVETKANATFTEAEGWINLVYRSKDGVEIKYPNKDGKSISAIRGIPLNRGQNELIDTLLDNPDIFQKAIEEGRVTLNLTIVGSSPTSEKVSKDRF